MKRLEQPDGRRVMMGMDSLRDATQVDREIADYAAPLDAGEASVLRNIAREGPFPRDGAFQ